MRPPLPMRRLRQHQRGVSAVLIVGVVVALSGLLTFGATLVSGQSAGLAQEIASARAQQAAAAALEWGRFSLGTGAPCVAVTQLNVPLSSGAWRATVQCTEATYAETGTVPAPRISQLTATACNLPGAAGCPNPSPGTHYAQQQVQGWVER
jgi:MSHA biogenesis protein MshP